MTWLAVACAMAMAVAAAAGSGVARADEPARELPWRRVHGEFAASYWLGGDARSAYGVGSSPGIRATLGVGVARTVDINASFRFVSIDSGLARLGHPTESQAS